MEYATGKEDQWGQTRFILKGEPDDATPERFVRQMPVPPALPTAAWINPPKPLTVSEDVAQ